MNASHRSWTSGVVALSGLAAAAWSLGCLWGDWEALFDTAEDLGPQLALCVDVHQEEEVGAPAASGADAGFDYCYASDDDVGRFDRHGAVDCVADPSPATPGCTRDADCAADEVCLCSAGVVTQDGSYLSFGTASRCIPATCRQSEDCASGLCGLSFDSCGEPASLRCRRRREPCRTTADCPSDEGWQCRYRSDPGEWGCEPLAECTDTDTDSGQAR